jgi:hypothetical protein
MRPHCILLLFVMIMTAWVLPAAAQTIDALGGLPCPDSDFTCITLSVPLDHTNPDDPRTIDVVFAILPATGERRGMFERVRNGIMITMQGGPHVLFGRDESCPDVTVTNWLVNDEKSAVREFICPGEVISEYFSPTNADETLTIGCDLGGSWTFEPTDAGEAWTLDSCAMLPDVTITGDGVYDYDADFLRLHVTLGGAVSGELVYLRDWAADTFAVSGTFNGRPARALP